MLGILHFLFVTRIPFVLYPEVIICAVVLWIRHWTVEQIVRDSIVTLDLGVYRYLYSRTLFIALVFSTLGRIGNKSQCDDYIL